MRRFLILAAIAMLFVLAGCGTTVQFDAPDIKDDFCGVHIDFQFCKCAFHNDFCDQVGMSRSEANSYVNAQYDAWASQQLAHWLAACEQGGGIPGVDDCTYCDEGFVRDGDECVEEDVLTFDDRDDDTAFTADGPLLDDCSIDDYEFDRDWRKYSDIDERIDFSERSYEAKQAVTAYDTMIERMVEAFALERDVEIEQQMQLELEEYRAALVQDLQTNLLKAFWRLSWVTYTTVKSGSGAGKSYAKVLTTGASAESVGAGLKVVQSIVPKDSDLAIDQSTIEGKATSVGAKVALDAVDSLGSPTAIATSLFKNAANAALPSADISAEEVAILRDQHLTKGVVDEALGESRAEVARMQARMAVLETEIADLQGDIDRWEAEEKARVARSLEASCLELKEQYGSDE